MGKYYTFLQESSESRSRIDRIYTPKSIYNNAYNREIINSAGISDHDLVTTEILKKNLPFIGEGFFRLSQDTLEYAPFKEKAGKILKNVENDMNEQLDTQKQKQLRQNKNTERKRQPTKDVE